ncbi:hypothetical protein J6TS1_39810 [Siminovitchia terrae]|uniref:Uncharacterized protein n=1 Tax=Siminovitchia terrae TaxID=1914933 RepID=A0ABQ4L2M1_SIMTE|nr:hypothetical protein [Siminovitchia terrae]GIN98111.1 hypothetical protein J6TS1_39810 [Siminovitchia terrae]
MVVITNESIKKVTILLFMLGITVAKVSGSLVQRNLAKEILL